MSVRLRVPGDKSISHRALILACLAEGTSALRGLPASRDVEATRAALAALGARFAGGGAAGAGAAGVGAGPARELRVEGPARWRAPGRLECGNSGTSARLLAGLVAGLGVAAEIDGDASLRGRPMDRVVYPLQAMGARIRYLERPERLPIRVEARASGSLRPLRHRARVASAQVKSALLLAGLASRTAVEVVEPARSRDHTERLLAHLGAPVRAGEEAADGGDADPGRGAGAAAAGPARTRGWRAVFDPAGWDGRLAPLALDVPGDPSSAAFLVAASLLGGAEVEIEGVGLNPTRTEFVRVLAEMGGDVRAEASGETAGEPIGLLRARPSELRGFRIGPERVPWLLDEVPALAVLAARADGTSVLAGAGELRVKESDRLARLAAGLAALGVRCRERSDGLEIEGTRHPLRGKVRTDGDHRLAMAFGILGRLPGCEVGVDDPACVAVSYPGFWEDLARILPGGPG